MEVCQRLGRRSNILSFYVFQSLKTNVLKLFWYFLKHYRAKSSPLSSESHTTIICCSEDVQRPSIVQRLNFTYGINTTNTWWLLSQIIFLLCIRFRNWVERQVWRNLGSFYKYWKDTYLNGRQYILFFCISCASWVQYLLLLVIRSKVLPKGSNWWSAPLEYIFTGTLLQLADNPDFTGTAGKTATQYPIKFYSWLYGRKGKPNALRRF